MKIKMLIIMLVCVGLAGTVRAAENTAPVVSNVRPTQQPDCSKSVEITYDLADADGDQCYIYLKASIDGGLTWDVPVGSATGDITTVDDETRLATTVAPGAGKKIVWDLDTDCHRLVCQNLKVKIIAEDSAPGIVEMCFVPAGVFRTSTNAPVYLDAYWIDKYEVTNALYCQFLNAGGNADHFQTGMEIIETGAESYFEPVPGQEKYPVRYVTWQDAMAFCDWRSTAEGLPAGSYSLPTEAQWEKAAGWDPVQKKLWKYAVQSDSINTSMANYGNSVGTTKVGNYDYNSYYGCYDMCGNVWEWCADWYGGTYPLNGANPVGPESGTDRVIRGGSWHNDSNSVANSYLHHVVPSDPNQYIGFRCIRILQ